jgi:hypothetical protein
MFSIYVLLIETPEALKREDILELLNEEGSNSLGSKLRVVFNPDTKEFILLFKRNAEYLMEAIHDVTYELESCNLMRYFQGLEFVGEVEWRL